MVSGRESGGCEHPPGPPACVAAEYSCSRNILSLIKYRVFREPLHSAATQAGEREGCRHPSHLRPPIFN